MEFRQDDASLPRIGGIVERVGWLDRLKSGCEAKGYALEVALMRVAWLHLGDLASDEISPFAGLYNIHAQPNVLTISLNRFLSLIGIVTLNVSCCSLLFAIPATSRSYCVWRFNHSSAGMSNALSNATAKFNDIARFPEIVSLITEALTPVISESCF